MLHHQDSILRCYLSDNAVGASPEILLSMAKVSSGVAMPYGKDPVSDAVQTKLTELFEHDLDVYLVSTGTAANGLSLSALTPPWGAVLCHHDGHIDHDEMGAPEFFTHGAKIITVDGTHSKMDPVALKATIESRLNNAHGVQPSAISLSQATETGSVYTLDELGELSAIAHHYGLGVHMDGARFANALVALNVTPAQMSWRAGIDVLSFGATKNGAMTVDSVISFNPSLRKELAFRQKRAGQLISKMRFQSAQMQAYLENDLWRSNAKQANAMAARLRDGLRNIKGINVIGEPTANIIFCELPSAVRSALQAEGFAFYDDHWEPNVVRLVTSFMHTQADIDALLAAINNAIWQVA